MDTTQVFRVHSIQGQPEFVRCNIREPPYVTLKELLVAVGSQTSIDASVEHIDQAGILYNHHNVPGSNYNVLERHADGQVRAPESDKASRWRSPNESRLIPAEVPGGEASTEKIVDLERGYHSAGPLPEHLRAANGDY